MPYSRYYRSKLTKYEKDIYDQLCTGLEHRETLIAVNHISSNRLSQIYSAILYDYPQYFYVDFYEHAIVYQGSKIFLKPIYTLNEETVKNLQLRIQHEITPILKKMEGNSPADVVRFAHDWLVERCVYSEDSVYPKGSYNILGPFLCKSCVCSGYSLAFKYLLDIMRVRCMVVCGQSVHQDGKSGPHAWNLVIINGNSYHIDVTYSFKLDHNIYSRAYYLLSTREILEDHIISKDFPCPYCRLTGNFVKRVSGTIELMQYLQSAYKKGSTVTEVRLCTPIKPDQVMEMIQNHLSDADMNWFSHISSYWSRNGNRVFTIRWK